MIVMGNSEFNKYDLIFFRSNLYKTRNKKGINVGGIIPHTPGSNPVTEQEIKKNCYVVGDIQG